MCIYIYICRYRYRRVCVCIIYSIWLFDLCLNSTTMRSIRHSQGFAPRDATAHHAGLAVVMVITGVFIQDMRCAACGVERMETHGMLAVGIDAPRVGDFGWIIFKCFSWRWVISPMVEYPQVCWVMKSLLEMNYIPNGLNIPKFVGWCNICWRWYIPKFVGWCLSWTSTNPVEQKSQETMKVAQTDNNIMLYLGSVLQHWLRGASGSDSNPMGMSHKQLQ